MHGTGPGGPTMDAADELEQEIERTREHLGDTVQQLAAKAHVTTMARDRATELSERVKGKTAAARHRAQSLSQEQMARVREQISAVATPAREATPDQVRVVVAKGVAGARQRRVPLAVAVGVLVLGLIIIKWRRGR
jgi:CHASE3 domain sensor protein